MRTIITILLLSLFTLNVSSSYAQKKSKELPAEEKIKAEELNRAIVDKDFSFVATKAQTNLPKQPYTYFYDDDYVITIKGNTIKTHTNRINTSLFSPFEINNEMSEYTVTGTTLEKRGATVNVKARNVDNQMCNITFTIFSDGSGYMLYGGSNRMRFYGNFVAD